ncbi:MAG: TetR/AcrR family transcriptional regulator [Actinobacteria bacterium]|nr:TetR/AcrR family transcriptional regulator [Actinomycetota bacterium]
MAPNKSEALRRVVLDAALAISASTGPDALSLREVAREAGVSHQAPYHHFGDRAGIFAAIAEEGYAKLSEMLQHSRTQGANSMCEAYVHFALQHKGHFRVMFRSDLCEVANYPNALLQADRAFEILLDEAKSILGSDTTQEQAKLQATYMWSVAHGLATLLLDGPLENKIGVQKDVGTFVRQVVRMADLHVGA